MHTTSAHPLTLAATLMLPTLIVIAPVIADPPAPPQPPSESPPPEVTPEAANTQPPPTVPIRLWDFESDPVGAVPPHWLITETNPTKTLATWRITADDTAPSGSHTFTLTKSLNYNGTYNLAVAERSSFRDLDLTVKVKAVSGEEDQGGGPVWRCRDQDNYYICRFNPLESNYRVYVVKDGRRRQLKSVRVELEKDRWYAIRVVMKGPDIACYLDGRKLLEITDATFTEPGMVGLWTKADAVTSFDDLAVRVLPAPPEPTPSPSPSPDPPK